MQKPSWVVPEGRHSRGATAISLEIPSRRTAQWRRSEVSLFTSVILLPLPLPQKPSPVSDCQALRSCRTARYLRSALGASLPPCPPSPASVTNSIHADSRLEAPDGFTCSRLVIFGLRRHMVWEATGGPVGARGKGTCRPARSLRSLRERYLTSSPRLPHGPLTRRGNALSYWRRLTG